MLCLTVDLNVASVMHIYILTNASCWTDVGLLRGQISHALYTISHTDTCYRDFDEALKVTARAKSAFASDTADLYSRGRRLVLESVAAGVTCMRAHVEIDTTVNSACLDVALKLKQDHKGICDIEISSKRSQD